MRLFKYLFVVLICCSVYWAAAQPLPALIPYRNGDKWGYCDSNKKILIQPQWASAALFKNGQARVNNLDDGTSIIDPLGNYIIPPSVHWTGDTVNNIDRATYNAHDSAGRWGIIDTRGNILIPLLYDMPTQIPRYNWTQFLRYSEWSKRWMIAYKNGRAGIIGEHNETLIPFEYDKIRPCYQSTKYFTVELNGKHGIIDTNNNVIVAINYAAAEIAVSRSYQANHDMFIVSKKVDSIAYTGAVNRKGELIVPIIFSKVEYRTEQNRIGFYTERNGLIGWYDMDGKQLFEGAYYYFTFNSDSTVIITTKKIAKGRQKNSRPLWLYAEDEHGNRTLLRQGLLNAEGKLILSPKYDYVGTDTNDIIAYNYNPTNKLRVMRQTVINKHSNKVSYRWERVGKPVFQSSERGGSTGMNCGRSASRNYYDSRNGIYIEGANGRIYTFNKGKTNYSVTGYVANETSVMYARPLYYVVRSADTATAVVDTGLNFIIAPQKKYALVTGDAGQNTFVFKNDSLWGVVDSCMNICIAAQRLPIANAIRCKNVCYGFIKTSKYNTLAETLIDKKGDVGSNFKDRTIADYVNINRLEGIHSSPYFIVTDTRSGKIGFVSPDNQVLFPALSFKYKVVNYFAKNIFIVGENETSKLLNDQDKEYFEGLHPKHVNSTPYASLVELRCSYAANDFFYVNRNGLIYADNIRQN